MTNAPGSLISVWAMHLWGTGRGTHAVVARRALPQSKGWLAALACVLAVTAYSDREAIVRLDLGCPGSTVQRGWTAWDVGAGGNWEGRGPFTFCVEHALFDRDGFTVSLGPKGAVGYRSGPGCTGPLAAVIEEIVFGRVADPLTVTISGLQAGTYRVITWHNDSRGYEPLPVDVVVTDAGRAGVVVVEAHEQTGLRDATPASQADFIVTSDGQSDIVIRFLIDGAPNEHTALNGIEIIGDEAVYQAFRPEPGNSEERVLPEIELIWRPGLDAVRHAVYMGVSRDEFTLLETTETASHKPEGLRWGQTYYWRVDEIGHEGTHPGPTWSFTTADGKARRPSPLSGAVEVSRHPTLAWRPSQPTARHRVHLGTAPDRLVSVARQRVQPTLLLRDLDLGQTYYWRVDEVYGKQTVEGELWSFTVDAGAARHPVPADREGHVPTGAVLGWRPGDPTARHNVYFGSSPATLALVGTGQEEAAHALRDLAIGKTYHWRVDEVYDGGTVAGPVWSFTTGDWASGNARSEDMPSRRRSIVDIAGAWTGGYEKNVPADEEASLLSTDVCIVGGGSGGIGAAIAAARAGVDVLVVEREDKLGGTSTQGYVNSWEPGPGCSIAREIYERLCEAGHVVTKEIPYDETLTRAGMKSVQFEVGPFCQVVTDMLDETGRCRVLLETSFVEVETHAEGGRVWSIKAVGKNGQVYRIRAKVFIDCTGGAYLCQAAGCEVMLGEDAKERFGEPSAAEEPKKRLNALILGYRIRKSDDPVIQMPPNPPITCEGGYAFPVPSGDMLVNPCGGMMAGWELIDRGYEGAMDECKRRVQAHWHWLQKTRYPDYEFVSYAPMLGIRESYRVVGEYVLRQQDLLDGIEKQTHLDLIAIADHPMDIHGAGGGLGNVAAPYGVPYRCLIPKGWTNLLVACRGASFSHLAASSCRLSRTMIQLGHAAGLAAAQAIETNCGVGEIDVSAVQRQLGISGTGAETR